MSLFLKQNKNEFEDVRSSFSQLVRNDNSKRNAEGNGNKNNRKSRN